MQSWSLEHTTRLVSDLFEPLSPSASDGDLFFDAPRPSGPDATYRADQEDDSSTLSVAKIEPGFDVLLERGPMQKREVEVEMSKIGVDEPAQRCRIREVGRRRELTIQRALQ